MSIVDHELWSELSPYIKIEQYAPDGGHKRPRIRIEILPLPTNLKERALAAKMRCVACGSMIHPIRPRQGESKRSQSTHLYYAASCPLAVNIACSRGMEARTEYNRVRAVIGEKPVAQAQLFR